MNFNLVLPLDQFRRALYSVLPHAGKDDGRVRVYVGDPSEVVVAATDRLTAAVARVPLADSDGEVGVFDLPAQDAEDLVAQFRVPKSAGADDVLIRVRWEPAGLQVTEVSGLFDGERTLSLPAVAVEPSYPSVPSLLARVARAQAAGPEEPEMVSVTSAHLTRFNAAARAFGASLDLWPTGSGALLITCTPVFAGLCRSTWQDDATVAERREARARWVDDAAVLAEFEPERPSVPDRSVVSAVDGGIESYVIDPHVDGGEA